MSKVKVTKEGLFRTIREVVKEEGGAANATNVGGANFTPGAGEQYATPKAFKKKVKESNTSAPFEKKFKHGTHPGAKAMDYKQLFEKEPTEEGNISGIVQPSNLDQDAWDKATGYKSNLAKDIYKENYSKFKTETKTRTKPEQFHQAVKGIRRKVDEVAKLFEYCSQLKNELAEGDQPFTYGNRTEALVGKVQNSIRETLRKVGALTNENSVQEVLTQDDYTKAMEILKQIENKSPKIYRAILDMVIDIYPHSSKEIDTLLNKANIQVNEKVNK